MPTTVTLPPRQSDAVEALRLIQSTIVRPGLYDFEAALARLLEIQALAFEATKRAEGV